MSKIDPLLINDFNDSDVSDASDVAENLYSPKPARHSLEVINGHIDKYNMPTSSSDHWTIPTELVQKNTFTGTGMVGATGNVDFFHQPHFENLIRKEIYGPDDNSAGKSDAADLVEDDDFLPVPGLGVEFFLPYDCSLVLLTWNVHYEDDAPFTNGYTGDEGLTISSTVYGAAYGSNTAGIFGGGRRTWLRLYLDDAWVQGQERITFPGKQVGFAYDGFWESFDFQPCQGTRHAQKYWNGHHGARDLAKGWHSAGVRIFSNSNQARLRVRGMRYIYFR